MTINNYESVISNAEKRATRLGEAEIVPRVSDLHAISASSVGKLELEYAGEDSRDSDLVDRLLQRAVLAAFDARWQPEQLEAVCAYFQAGGGVEVSDMTPASEYLEAVRGIEGLADAVRACTSAESPPFIAAATELVLAGLHLHQKLNCETIGGRRTYRG